MTGVIKELLVAQGDSVQEGEPIMMMEAMKMDIEVSALSSGSVAEIYVQAGDNVKEGQALAKIG
jgi:pyruvate carboxylase subunit B